MLISVITTAGNCCKNTLEVDTTHNVHKYLSEILCMPSTPPGDQLNSQFALMETRFVSESSSSLNPIICTQLVSLL